MKPISILGSTGSIGRQALEIIDSLHSEPFHPVALTALRNIELLELQARKYKPKLVCVYDKASAETLKIKIADTPVKVLCGKEGLLESARLGNTVLNALVGIAGLEPTLAALEEKNTLLLANKESLVCGGKLVMEKAGDLQILPVDSEHSAIFQCLQSGRQGLRSVVLTASGGPFLNWSPESLKSVTPDMAKKHPNWNMGVKVTIDSATLLNKGLEFIEAMWLFGLSYTQIQVVIHPQSIIHSCVEYDDGAILAQMGMPDMRLPIQYALLFPLRKPCPAKKLDLCKIRELSFAPPDYKRFPCLALAMHAAKRGGNCGAILNAAGEWALENFLSGKISFLDIPIVIEQALDKTSFCSEPSLEDILNVNAEVGSLLSSLY